LHKIFTDVPSTNEIKNIDRKVPKQEKNYNNYFAELQKPQQSIPNVKGCQEWMRLLFGEFRVKVNSWHGEDTILQAGQDIIKNNTTLNYCDYTKRHII
jgi:cell division protein FtsI (penicillin-binding protein 3)